MTESSESTVIPDQDYLANKALEVFGAIEKLTHHLDSIKAGLRHHANGEKLIITVTGKGTVTVSVPRAPSKRTVLALDEEKLATAPEVKEKLLKTGFLVESEKEVPGAAASVSIKLNV